MFEQDSGGWTRTSWSIPFDRGINFEMSVVNVEELYDKVITARIVPFRRSAMNRYRSGTEESVQKEFLIQDLDGYLLRFTD